MWEFNGFFATWWSTPTWNRHMMASSAIAIKSEIDGEKYTKNMKPLTGWWVGWTPLKNISQLGWLFPIYGKIKNVPNHQPAKKWDYTYDPKLADVYHHFAKFKHNHWTDHHQQSPGTWFAGCSWVLLQYFAAEDNYVFTFFFLFNHMLVRLNLVFEPISGGPENEDHKVTLRFSVRSGQNSYNNDTATNLSICQQAASATWIHLAPGVMYPGFTTEASTSSSRKAVGHPRRAFSCFSYSWPSEVRELETRELSLQFFLHWTWTCQCVYIYILYIYYIYIYISIYIYTQYIHWSTLRQTWNMLENHPLGSNMFDKQFAMSILAE